MGASPGDHPAPVQLQRPRCPPPSLLPEVVTTWTATIQGRHRLIPDGCADLVCIEGGPVWLCGPEQRSWEFELPPGTRAVGVRFRPGAVGRVFRTDVDQLANRLVRLEDLRGGRTERQLAERLVGADPQEQLSHLEQLVGRWLDATVPSSDLDLAIAAAAVGRHPARVGELAAELQLSTRQLHRRACRQFGYGYSVLVRLIRFQRFILAGQAGAGASIAELAALAGYTDQAHLARECRAISGTTPTGLLASHERTFPAGSDPYKPAPLPEC